MFWLESIIQKTRFNKRREAFQNQIRIITSGSHQYHHGHDREPSETTDDVSLIQSSISSEESISDTPPPLILHLSPFSRVELPDLSEEPITLHPLLAYDRLPSIIWEVIQLPSLAHLSSHLSSQSVVNYHWKSLPALNPPHIGSMTIKFEPFEKYIVVFPKGNFITIGDVLSTIYNDARKQATERYYLALGLDMDDALVRLYPRALPPPDEPAAPPVTPEFALADHQDNVASNVRGLLEYRTVWAGLTPSVHEPDVWLCHTRHPSRLPALSTGYVTWLISQLSTPIQAGGWDEEASWHDASTSLSGVCLTRELSSVPCRCGVTGVDGLSAGIQLSLGVRRQSRHCIAMIFKIPFILLDALWMRLSATPPNPTLPRKEHIIPDWRERFLKSLAYPSQFLRIVYWLTGIFETAVILGNLNPNGPISRIVLHILIQKHTDDNNSTASGLTPVFNTTDNLLSSSSSSSPFSCIWNTLILAPAPASHLNLIRITPVFILGTILTGLGTYLRLSCYRTLGKFFTFELSIFKEHTLITCGPYAHVRHPSYSGLILTIIGHILHSAAAGSWVRESGFLDSWVGVVVSVLWVGVALAVILSLVLRIPREDALLKKEFGGEWEEWAGKVPYRLIPYIY
ncbi:hypothetical protein CVT24_004605 [Panaeolus cyanescens]|uniref:Protein-S-isoprenylcysteine O-methyltransferase n=1 Tax=Panaeolus cyanescens TaxID=181874 RepID=A0A409YBE1_9AGAR|nr:hypothetical protein CVT24_004605 [Panaeolus cyanescens]